MKTTITPHENEGRKYLLVGGLPVEATEIRIVSSLRTSLISLLRSTLIFQYKGTQGFVHLDNWGPQKLKLLTTIHTEGNALVNEMQSGWEKMLKYYRFEDGTIGFLDYMKSKAGINEFFVNPQDSLLSLLESKGYTMLNPYGEKEPVRNIEAGISIRGSWIIGQSTAYDMWRTSEDKRHKFKVAVIEVNQ